MLTSPLLITLTGLTFGLLHTALASLRAKNWARRRWGLQRVDRYYRLFFSLASIVTFLPLLILPQALPDRPLYTIPLPLVWLTGALQLAAGLIFILALAQTDVWHFIAATLARRPTHPRRPARAACDQRPLSLDAPPAVRDQQLSCAMRHLFSFRQKPLWQSGVSCATIVRTMQITRQVVSNAESRRVLALWFIV